LKTHLISLILFIIPFNGCNFKESKEENALEGNWQLYDITSKNEDDLDFSTTANLKKQVKDGSILNFYSDNTYSEIDGAGIFKNGKWGLKEDNSFYMVDPELKARSAGIKTENNQKNKKIKSLQIESSGFTYKYIKVRPPLKIDKDDPFYVANNQWRKKSTTPETKIELYHKMSGYFKHLALVLKAAKELNQEIISFEYSKGPVKIYNGAIGIYPFNVVPQEWKNTFYDESGAFAAYTLFENYLRTNNYKGAGVGNWIEDDYNILLSIYADFMKPEN
jgi:hypothetical protein